MGTRRDGPADARAFNLPLTPASGSVSASGNNTCVTPTSGKRLRVIYASYNNKGGAVEAAFRFGAAGTLWLRNALTVAGGVIAKDTGGFWCLEGAVDEALILNLDTAVEVIWNAFYVEVP